MAKAAGRTVVSNPAGVAAPLRPYYSTAVSVSPGPLLFISGQVAWDEDGAVVGVGDPAAQARQVFANLETVLQAHGAGLQDVVKVTVYVTSLDWFDQLAAIRRELFTVSPPASAIVQVVALVQPELLIEVEAVAAIPG